MEDYCHYIKLPACVENNNEACTSDAGKPTRKWQQKLQWGSTKRLKVENLNRKKSQFSTKILRRERSFS